MIASTIILIAGIALAAVVFAWSMRRFLLPTVGKGLAITIIILGALCLAYLCLNLQAVLPATWVQLALTLGLVSATALMAISIFKQAGTSVKMAEKMEEQLLSETRPYLLLRLTDESVPWDPKLGLPAHWNFTVTILNAGKGPATNLLAALWYPNRNPFFDIKGYLVSGEEWEAVMLGLPPAGMQPEKGKEGWLPELSKLVKHPELGVVAVEYKDVHKRKWVSYLCLERPVNDESVAIEGEQNIVELKEK